MQKKLSAILNNVARGILARRVLESIAIAATAGGFCAAVVMLSWWLRSSVQPFGAGISCILLTVLAASGLLVGVRGSLRTAFNLDASLAVIIGAECIFSAAASAAAMLPGWAMYLSPWFIAVTVMSAGVLAGAVTALARGVSALQAAVYLDIHSNLHEQLSTAAEAAESDGADSPCAGKLYAQALAALSSIKLDKLSYWKRTRVTPAALALSIALCVVAAMLPGNAESPEAVTKISDLPHALETMTSVQVRRLAAALNLEGHDIALTVQARGAALDAAHAVQNRDSHLLRRALERLDHALAVAGQTGRRQKLLSDIMVAMSSGVGNGDEAIAGDGDESPDSDRLPVASRSEPAEGSVAVYDPLYAKAIRSLAQSGSKTNSDTMVGKSAADSHVPDNSSVDLNRIWLAAKEKASRAVASGQVPSQYRLIVRGYFSIDGQKTTNAQ